jgi:hypothetical protein
MNSEPSVNQTATKKEKFDLGIEMIKGYYDGLETRAERTAVLLVAVVGWLITSGDARDALLNYWPLFWGAIFSLTVFLIYYFLNISHFIKRFRQIQSQVEKLNYVDPKYFTRYRMPKTLHGIPPLGIYMIPIVVLYLVIVLLMVYVRYR